MHTHTYTHTHTHTHTCTRPTRVGARRARAQVHWPLEENEHLDGYILRMVKSGGPPSSSRREEGGGGSDAAVLEEAKRILREEAPEPLIVTLT